ncbi:MAG: 50S ribosomal protein L9 [Spirochaetaceae bacterium]|jgi:large subunit ribosomal protein L9|nr:50S ribosomal protein L9 [Spirochaetaceae bacterium]
MKVILNKDLYPLGEEGDIRDVAKGYARNYLFPRGFALPHTDKTIKLFESRREEIEARKADKRKDAAGIKEKLEALDLVITMPAGANGKLYGAVTVQTVVDELAKNNYQTERKRVEIPGNSIKSVGKYKVTVKLYESASAEITITVQAQIVKAETKASPPRKDRRRQGAETGDLTPAPAEAEAGSEGVVETQAEVPAAVQDQEPVPAEL